MKLRHFFTLPYVPLGLLSVTLVCIPMLASAQADTNPGEAFRRLATDSWITRSVAFSELGFKGPMVLASTDTRREIYLPVPANVPLSEGALQLDANYLRADGGRTTMVVSLDSYPVSARAFTENRGDASLPLGVDGTARASGFVRLGVNWSTALSGTSICFNSQTPGNILRVEPTSRFSYRYDGAAIRDLTTAWGALPTTAVILVASGKLAAESYDTAWRLGVAMDRAGKRSVLNVVPAVGDVVDLEGTVVPPALRAIPAFAALAGGGKHKMADNAEIGALLSLGQSSPFRGDIVIADKALLTSMDLAFNALAEQIKATAPGAVTAFTQWRARIDPGAKAIGSNEVRVGSIFGRPAILVAPDAGAKVAGLFGQLWRNIGVSSALAVQAAEVLPSDGSVISLKSLGGSPASFDVLGRAEWTATFDLASVSAEGRLPTTLMLDVSAAPGAARAAPVASVFLNDILLGAKHLNAKGARERISARIPRSALAARNVLKVSFVRQLSSDDCRETPEAYPAAVLASSHLVLGDVEPDSNFTGMLSRFAAGADLMLPTSYLDDARATLPRVIYLASSTGVSATNATLSWVAADKVQDPLRSFLAMDVPFAGNKNRVNVDGDRLVLADHSKRTLLDIEGLDRVGTLEVATVDGKEGIIYQTVGAHAPQLDQSFQLARGNFAAIGSQGLLTELDTDNASGRDLIEDDQSFSFRKSMWLGLPALGLVFFIALMVYASRVRRRKAIEKAKL